MKQLWIIVLALFVTIPLVGCTNNQNKQLQQENDLLKQQNILLQQEGDQEDAITNPPGYVTDIANTTNATGTTGDTKTIPFEAVGPTNNNNANAYY